VPSTTTPLPAVGLTAKSTNNSGESLTAELVDRLNPFRKGAGK
jgi:phospholipid/cholesterol/gamma-HCH transport system substrate-binding protein